MRSLNLLQVRYPHEKTGARFFIDGKRVSREVFRDITARAVRRDTFQTKLVWLDGTRHRIRDYSVAYV